MPRAAHPRSGPEPLAAKVPEILALFWVLKLLTTGMGEAMSDFLGSKSVPIAGLIGIVGISLALWIQTQRTQAYNAVAYWFAVMMVAVFGTMAADGIHDGAHLGYAVTTPLFAIAVAVIFALWYRSEGTLSIHTIVTRRREAYYWAAVLATFALGTAAGDLTATTLGLGFFPSALLFSALILIPAIGWRAGWMNPVVAFWIAYVLTRPIGASFADWLSKPPSITGLGLGDGTVSGLALIVFVALVAYTAITKRDIQTPAIAHGYEEREQEELARHAVRPQPHVEGVLGAENA